MRRVGATLLLLLAGLAVALGLGELLVRVVAPQQRVVYQPDLWQPDEGLGWSKRPHARVAFNTGDGPATVITDAEGYRIGAEPPADAQVNLLLVGDSFVEAIQVEHEQSLAAQLEDALAAELGVSVRVWNAGTSAWGPSQYLEQTRRSLETHRFDAVLVGIYLGNDFEPKRRGLVPARNRSDRHAFRMPTSLAPREWVQALLYPLNDVLERHSHLAVLLKQRFESLLMRVGLSAAYFPVELVPSSYLNQAWENSADVCQDLRRLTRRHDTPLQLFLIPSRYQVDDRVLEQYMDVYDFDRGQVSLDLPNRSFQGALRQRGLSALDPTWVLRRASGEPLYGRVDAHLAPEGHRRIAEWLAPQVAALLAPAEAAGR